MRIFTTLEDLSVLGKVEKAKENVQIRGPNRRARAAGIA